jgi:hypothetical protein
MGMTGLACIIIMLQDMEEGWESLLDTVVALVKEEEE